MAFPDGTGAGKPSHSTPTLTQCPNRKNLVLERVSTFRKSAFKHHREEALQHVCCTLYSMLSLHTVWYYSGNQCCVLCFACCCVTLHRLHTSNANANHALVRQYRHISAVVNKLAGRGEGRGRGEGGRKRCQTMCITCRSTTGMLRA